MRQLLLDLKSGEISLEEVPMPGNKKGVIIETHFSALSPGTESSLMSLASKSLVGKARDRPDLAIQVLQKMKTDGLFSGYSQANVRLERPETLGYSCAGIVTETNVDEFQVGDRVACAGTGYATHSEFNYVPKNLCAKIPKNVTLRDASFTTLGAIALQGIRNADIKVGESIVVIGLGLIGLLTVQILKASGCKVFAIDIDSKKNKIARELGADYSGNYQDIEPELSNSLVYGADSVIITAATKSNVPIEKAGDYVRKGGTVVVVGAVNMDIPRNVYYDKEAKVIVSRSYGPGRYDRNYEEKGLDYPIDVRWTEKRNMEAFLQILSENKINISKMISHEFDFYDSLSAYRLINDNLEPYIGVTLKYETDKKIIDNKISIASPKKVVKSKTIGVIGSGLQASNALLPHLSKQDVVLKGIASTTGASCQPVAKKFGFEYCTTDYRKILDDESIDTVIIATRNDTHAKIVADALNKNKIVFVEKPLATNSEELDDIVKTLKITEGQIFTGFNRRYAPMAIDMKKHFSTSTKPLIINYRINAGPIFSDNWVNDESQGGGMLITECCHFIDFVNFIVGSKPTEIFCKGLGGTSQNSQSNLQIVISYEDGSIGNICYTTLGNKNHSKEFCEIFGDGKIGIIRDYKESKLILKNKTISKKSRFSQDKGHNNQMNVFLKQSSKTQEQDIISSYVTIKAKESLFTGSIVKLNL